MNGSATSRDIAARFTAAAATYDRHAAVQRIAAERVAALVAELPAAGRVLEIGCGTGLLTELLANAMPCVELHAVDLSATMIQRATERLRSRGNISWIVGDAAELETEGQYDLVVSSSSLHWFDRPDQLFAKLHDLLTAGGHVVFEMMLEGTLAELHAARARVAPGKPVRSRLSRKEHVLSAVGAAGFALISCRQQRFRADYPSAREFLAGLHEQGLTGGPVSRAATPLNRGEIMALMTDYDRNYRNDNGAVTATYETLLVAARKPEQ